MENSASERSAASLSSEELDHLERSTKKIKATDISSNVNMDVESETRSFKQTLMWGKQKAAEVTALGNLEKVLLEEDGLWSDDEATLESDIPMVSLDKEQKKALRRPWCSSVIVKVLGKSVKFETLQQRLPQVWRLDGEFNMVDLGQGYYVVKFDEKSDFTKVLTGGPWKILDHYLLVQRWIPNFRPSTAVFKFTPIWIRLPELPIEYFQEDILLSIARLIGTPLKMDANITLAARGKYARVCVEVDLSKPLIPREQIGNLVQIIEYEALHTVCFGCGLVGHCAEYCPKKPRVVDDGRADGQKDSGREDLTHTAPSKNYGPWMLVKRKSRKPLLSKPNQAAGSQGNDFANRFHSLDEPENFHEENENHALNVEIWKTTIPKEATSFDNEKFKAK